MKSLLLFLLPLVAFAQQIPIGIQDRPCDFVPGNNNLALDFGGFCKYEAANLALRQDTANRVIYFGDSITEMWGKNIPGLDQTDTINRGYSGQTTSQMRVRFRADVIKLKPRIVHIMAGTNDIAGNTGPTTLERIKDNIRSMCEDAQMHGIRVVIGSVLPAKVFSWRPGMKPAENIRLFNQWLKTYAQNSGFTYADYYSAMVDSEGGLPASSSTDGVHPTPVGYAIMQPIAIQAINEANRK